MKKLMIATASIAALTLASPAFAGGISPGAAVGIGVGSLVLGGILGSQAQAQPYYGQGQTYGYEASPRYYAPRRHRRYAQPRYRHYRYAPPQQQYYAPQQQYYAPQQQYYAPQQQYYSAPQQYGYPDSGYGYTQQCSLSYDVWGQPVQNCQ